MTSLFRRVTRYSVGARVDPAENRLTESFAAVLAVVPTLRQAVAERLADRPLGTDIRVATQLSTDSGGYVDLQLVVGPITRPDHTIWVEIKHGSLATAAQMQRYRADIERTGAISYSLILLTPDGTKVPPLPAGCRSVRWQQLWGFMSRWMSGHRTTLNDVEVYLVTELLEFMREESLDDPGALRGIDVIALTNLDRARKLIARLRDGAEAVVLADWTLVGRTNRDNGRFWRHFRPLGVTEAEWSAELRGGWFEWGLTRDRRLPNPRKELVFGAGYTFRGKNPPPGPDVSAWVRDLENRGFILAVDDHWRFYRYLYLDAVLVHAAIEIQAQMVGDWVKETYRVLRQHPLGPGPT